MIRGVDVETDAVFVGDADVVVATPSDDDKEVVSDVCVVDTSGGMTATGGGDSVGEMVDVRVAEAAAAAAAAFLLLLLAMIEGTSIATNTPAQKRIWHILVKHPTVFDFVLAMFVDVVMPPLFF